MISPRIDGNTSITAASIKITSHRGLAFFDSAGELKSSTSVAFSNDGKNFELSNLHSDLDFHGYQLSNVHVHRSNLSNVVEAHIHKLHLSEVRENERGSLLIVGEKNQIVPLPSHILKINKETEVLEVKALSGFDLKGVMQAGGHSIIQPRIQGGHLEDISEISTSSLFIKTLIHSDEKSFEVLAADSSTGEITTISSSNDLKLHSLTLDSLSLTSSHDIINDSSKLLKISSTGKIEASSVDLDKSDLLVVENIRIRKVLSRSDKMKELVQVDSQGRLSTTNENDELHLAGVSFHRGTVKLGKAFPSGSLLMTDHEGKIVSSSSNKLQVSSMTSSESITTKSLVSERIITSSIEIDPTKSLESESLDVEKLTSVLIIGSTNHLRQSNSLNLAALYSQSIQTNDLTTKNLHILSLDDKNIHQNVMIRSQGGRLEASSHVQIDKDGNLLIKGIKRLNDDKKLSFDDEIEVKSITAVDSLQVEGSTNLKDVFIDGQLRVQGVKLIILIISLSHESYFLRTRDWLRTIHRLLRSTTEKRHPPSLRCPRQSSSTRSGTCRTYPRD